MKFGILSFSHRIIQKYLKGIVNFLGFINGGYSFLSFVFTNHYRICPAFGQQIVARIAFAIP